MLSYWGQISAKTSDSSNERWLDTGDVGSIDEYGNLWLIGRKKGQIKSGGENIYPEEVVYVELMSILYELVEKFRGEKQFF